MDYAIQQLLNALSFGTEYSLLALGLAIVFSIMRLVNFAHGEIIGMGAYAMYVSLMLSVSSPLAIVAIALAVSTVSAMVFERVAFRPVRNAPTTTGLLTAFGVSILVQNGFVLLVSSRSKPVPIFGFLNTTIDIGSFTIQALQLLQLSIAVVTIVVLTAFLKYTTMGLAMRAAAREFSTVRLMGVRANRVISAAFAISGLLAGIAGVFMVARRGSIQPDMGFLPVLKAFVACVIGGFGSLSGAIAGGMLLGFLEVLILISLPQEYGGLKDAAVFSIVALLLSTRPGGILGSTVELGDKEA